MWSGKWESGNKKSSYRPLSTLPKVYEGLGAANYSDWQGAAGIVLKDAHFSLHHVTNWT